MASTISDVDIAARVPSEVWEQIFGHASVLQLLEFRLICRSWRSIVDGCPALMKRILLKFPAGFVLDREYREPRYLVPARNLSLEQVRITSVGAWWPKFAERLEFLSLKGCKICVTTLLKALEPMVNLKVLKFSEMEMWKSSGSAVNFELKQVEELTADDLNEEMFCLLAPLFTQLKWIDLPRLYEVYEPGVSERIITDMLRTLKHTLEGVTIDYSPRMLDEILQIKQLTHLKVRTGDMNNLELTEIGTELTNLKCIQVCLSSSTEIPTFLETMPNLEEICLISEQGELDFAEFKNPRLRRFKCCALQPIVSSLFRYLESSPDVTDICFDNCRFPSEFELFSVLELFCQTLQRLELRLLYVEAGDNHHSKCFESLTYLRLDRCTMDETLLISLIRRCPRLEEVHLESMDNFNDRVLLALCRELEHLETLTLNRCPVTASSADYLVKHCRALKRLTIRGSVD